MQKAIYVLVLIGLLLTACTRSVEEDLAVTPDVYSPFVPLDESATIVPVVNGTVIVPTLAPTQRTGPTWH